MDKIEQLLLSECIYKVLMASGVVTSSDACDLSGAIEAAVLEAQSTDQRLLNLLCRIHRDGGHYIAEHGLDKAVEDADLRVAEQNAALDAQAKQEPFDADDPRFREAFEASLKSGNWPMTRLGEGYRSSITMMAFTVAYETVNRLRLYAAPVVQPNMVMVPREPTEAMLDAAMNRYQHVSPEAKARYTQMHRENFRCDYKAMIAAAEGKSNARLTVAEPVGRASDSTRKLDIGD